MTQRATGQRFRQRKLSTKQNLPVLREHEVEKAVDEDAQRHLPRFETGVEKGEEIEHHLQAAISASQAAVVGGKVAQITIPTPETIASSLQYDDLYPRQFSQPATYIRFSSTVEDCIGCPYCATIEDQTFLKVMNAKRTKPPLCTEGQFEDVMYFFEEVAHSKQPFAAVDNPPVISYEEIEGTFDENLDPSARMFAKDIYPHWRSQRLKRGNRSLMPTLKFETGQETDDADPYVCFRRREVRQARKTRGRDAQVVEKLKKLRKELEDARQLVHLVKQREVGRKDQLALDKQIFEQRVAVKEAKRNLGVKGDDEDLINQKPSPKPKPKVEGAQIARGLPGLRPGQQMARVDGRPTGSDLVSLQETLLKKEEEIQKYIDENVVRHQNWNKGWVDITWRPITPPLDDKPKSSFRSAVTEYLPTPPTSVSSEPSLEIVNADEASPKSTKESSLVLRSIPPPNNSSANVRPSFRRRIGRGGRLMIDRRGVLPPTPREVDERIVDRYKYDVESEEDEETYTADYFDNMSIKYRVLLKAPNRDPALQQAGQAPMAAVNPPGSQSRPRTSSGPHTVGGN